MVKFFKTQIIQTTQYHIFSLMLMGLFLLPFNLLAEAVITKPASNQVTKKPLTLRQAIEKTLQNNPKLAVFNFKQAAVDGELETAKLSPQMQVGFNAENMFGSGDSRLLKSAEMTLSVSSVIELGEKRQARIAYANVSRDQVDMQQKRVTLDLLSQLTKQYIETLAAQEKLKLAKSALQLAEQVVTTVKKRAKVGATPEAEVKRAQAGLIQAQLTIKQKHQQYEYQKNALRLFWEHKLTATSTDFDFLMGDLYQFGQTISFEQLLAKLQQNPELQILMAKHRLKSAELSISNSRSTSDLAWTLGVKHNHDSEDTSLVAGFSIPLNSQRQNKGEIRRLSAQRDEVLLEQQSTLLMLHNQLYRAFSYREQAIETVTTLQNQVIPLLKQALAETEQAYQVGRYTYIDWIAAQQDLLNSQESIINNAVAALQYSAEIEQLTAQSLSSSDLHFSELAGIKQ